MSVAISPKCVKLNENVEFYTETDDCALQSDFQTNNIAKMRLVKKPASATELFVF